MSKYLVILIDGIISIFSKLEETFPRRIGYIYHLVGTFSFIIYDLLMKSQTDIPSFQLYWNAEIIMTTGVFLWLQYRGSKVFYNKKINLGLIARGLIAFFGNLAQAYGIRKVYLSEGVVLKQTYPAFAGILGVFFLKEKYDLSQFLFTLLNFLGVILIAKPTFLFGSPSSHDIDPSTRIVGVAALLACGIMMAVRTILARIQMVGNVDAVVSIYYSVLIQTYFIPSFIFGQGIKVLSLSQTARTFLASMLMFLGAFLVTRSMKFGSAGKISLMAYSSLVFGYILDIYLLGTKLELNSILGSLLIFSCIFLQIKSLRKT